MEDYTEDLADYFGRTVVHPVGLALVIALALAILVLPRRWSLLPFVLLGCFVSQAQRVVVAGIDLDFVRILTLAAWLRVLVRREASGFRWNAVDTCVVAYAVCGFVTFLAYHGDGDALRYRLGWAYDLLGLHLLLRLLLAGDADPRRVTRLFAMAAVPVAAFFAVELATHHNLFSVFGGVPEVTWVRDGRLRCQGPFAHPVVAGVYWASQLPLLGALWFSSRAALREAQYRGVAGWSGLHWRTWAVVGVAASSFVILATNSSTSVTAVLFGLVAFLAYPLRGVMAWVRWGFAALLVVLHVTMKAPVWHLLARATVFDASTGWHRFFVIDQSVHHFGDWWLFGTGSTDTWEVWDITNEYVRTGIEGGLATLLALLVLLGCCFGRIGRQCAQLRDDPAECRIRWALGCALFVHCTSFIGLAYYGQAKFAWSLLVALIASQEPKPAPCAAVAQASPADLGLALPARARGARWTGEPG